MNKKVVAVIFITLLALAVLTLYSFGPLAGRQISNKPQSASMKAAGSVSLNTGEGQRNFFVYHNRDISQNYFTVAFPAEWKVAAAEAGGYDMSYTGGTGTLRLRDVPDNTTLELMVLSQQEPALKKSVPGYSRSAYEKITVNGQEAYRLVYTDRSENQTVRTFISGPDKAAILSFTSTKTSFPSLQPDFNAVVNSFKWDSK